MKFDYDLAWKETTRLLSGNFSLLAVIAGALVFLPYAVLMLALPGMEALANPDPAGDIDAMMATMTEFYKVNWWALLLLAIAQSIGLLAMLALLKGRSKPTVGEALATGAKTLLTYFAAQLLQSFGLVLVLGLLVGLAGATGSVMLGLLAGAIALVLAIYVLIKLSLVAPVVAIEGVANPFAALARSWQMTRGNSLRLFGFYLLLLAAGIVVSMVASMLINLFFALFGAEAARFGTAISSALVNAGFMVLMVAILAAVHAQFLRIADSIPAVEG